MKSFITTCFITLFLAVHMCLFLTYGGTDEEEELKLYAQSVVLMDAESGRILYGKEEFLQRPMASTTKIMTCILALEHGNLEDVVTVSSYAAGQPKVHLGARTKDTFYLKDLLYSLMLESHNDTAVMIAEHIGGDVKGFADMMNEKAKEIGCSDTYFITPNGLDAVETDASGMERMHSTTAKDLAKIMSYCVWESPKKEDFLTITQTQNYYFSNLERNRSFNCTNHNAFLTMMSGALSGKTGFTNGAGYSYIAALQDGNRKYVVALLGCGWPPQKSYKWSDTKQLFSYGLEKYDYKEVYEEKVLEPIWVREGIPKEGDVSSQAYATVSLNHNDDEKTLRVLMKEGEAVEVSYHIVKELQAPVQEGTMVGNVSYYLDGQRIQIYPVYTTNTVEKITWKWCFKQVTNLFFSKRAWSF